MGGFINDDLFKEDAAVFREEIDIRQLRSQFEVKVNRKMEPIERLAATNLDKESSAAQKRLVPMVILIIILRIFLVRDDRYCYNLVSGLKSASFSPINKLECF